MITTNCAIVNIDNIINVTCVINIIINFTINLNSNIDVLAFYINKLDDAYKSLMRF